MLLSSSRNIKQVGVKWYVEHSASISERQATKALLFNRHKVRSWVKVGFYCLKQYHLNVNINGTKKKTQVSVGLNQTLTNDSERTFNNSRTKRKLYVIYPKLLLSTYMSVYPTVTSKPRYVLIHPKYLGNVSSPNPFWM